MFSITGIIKEAYKLLKEKKDPVKGIIAHPLIYKKLFDIRKRIYTVIADMTATVAVTKEPVTFSERVKLDYKPLAVGEAWGDFFECGWFNFQADIPEIYKHETLCAYIDIGAEGCVFDEQGAPQIGVTGILSFMDFFGSSKGKHIYRLSEYKNHLDIWLDAGNNGFSGVSTGFAKLKGAYVASVNEALLKLYYDYWTLFLLMTTVDKDTERFVSLLQGLKEVNCILRKYTEEEITQAGNVLSALLAETSDETFEFYAVGHAHLDLAWLWPIRETKRKAARTFSNQLSLIERYKGYVFGASQPQQFDWTKELYPALYERIKKAVSEGNLEPQGGMWVEPDTNITGSESLVRQVLYGKQFFKEEFGKDMRVLWLPDVFGFTGALPQIIKKTGMDYFLTIKLNWNKINVFPYHSFIWEGIDDSAIIVHMPPDGTYNSEGGALTVRDSYKKYKQKETDCALMLFGVGDGGGGPGEGHVEVLRREKSLKGLKKVKFSPAIDFFDKLNEKRDILPTVKGELYLETHQGTLTTQCKNKLYNRKIENALRNVELLAAYAGEKGYEYPKAQLDKIWKEVLLYQFHDIIPGSSIHRVYVESTARYEEMLEELKILEQSILSYIAKGKTENRVINTLPYPRSEYHKLEDKWQLCEVAPFASAKCAPSGEIFRAMTFEQRFIESDKFRIFFNRDGSIKALFEKQTNRNYAGDYLNKLTVYKDKKMFYDAWDIDINYTKRIKQYFRLVSFENIIDGPKVIRRNYYKYNKSTLTQEVVLTYNSDRVEFHTEVDWQESHKMLRADFRPAVYSDKVLCNIQWGNIERSTKTDNPVDYAQHEIAAHKFVYVNNDSCGFALLNDCKYGHRVKDGLISLNLLRSPDYPDETADKGKHNFSYAIFASSGKNLIDKVTEQAYCFNIPLINSGYAASFDSLVLCDSKNIITETVKRAESGDGIVLRLYESAGRQTRAEIKLGFKQIAAYETDMLENNPQTTNLSTLEFKPYEIKTILITNKTKETI
ncbi:MAG: alpha-mannosidase [Clostridia bacterium]|nr:alpha-mannosidase [Clostridia bacterium]